MKFRKFVDRVNLNVTAGNGGNGSASFRREKFIPLGGPDGGDGGNGGSVILEGNRDEDSLVSLFFQPLQRAEDAGAGRCQKQHGRNGRDRLIKIPCGTEVRNAVTDELVGEVLHHGEQLVVARGGKGGKGNVHFRTSTNRAPRDFTEGGPGEQFNLKLELKLMADIGLVGFPNAGKSSLLTSISHAHPKIGAYPFTTLNPIIGTIQFEDYRRMTMADLPGLIKDAHKGVGLGHDFLRHIERSRFLLYVIDMAGNDGRDPREDYQALRNELKLYNRTLVSHPSLIAANKMDLPEAAANLKEFRKKTRGMKIIPISTVDGTGLPELKDAVEKMANEVGHFDKPRE